MNNVCIVGERGMVSSLLQDRIRAILTIKLTVVSTSDVLMHVFRFDAYKPAIDLVILCVQDFQSATIVDLIPPDIKILDVSPTFRCDPTWTYGLLDISVKSLFRSSNKIANPGCFATAAILLIKPLIQYDIISPDSDLYLDAVGGYTTGGSKLIDESNQDVLAPEMEYGLTREHRHISEIKTHCGLTGNICFTPKIANFPRGIRMQIFIPNSNRDHLLQQYTNYYINPEIIIDMTTPSKIRSDEWAYKEGACIRIYQQGSGCLVICLLDNMGKGAIDTAMNNMSLILSLS